LRYGIYDYLKTLAAKKYIKKERQIFCGTAKRQNSSKGREEGVV
jgi:hypothetical protein